MQRARFWILCALGALVVMAGALLMGSRYLISEAQLLKSLLSADVDMRLDNLTLREAGEDGRSLILDADMAHYYKSRDLFLMERVRARILTDDGNYTVDADSGRYEQSQKVMTLTGSVRVVNENEAGILTTESLIMKFDQNVFFSEESFCYTTPTADLNGSSFVFNSKSGNLLVNGRTYLLF